MAGYWLSEVFDLSTVHSSTPFNPTYGTSRGTPLKTSKLTPMVRFCGVLTCPCTLDKGNIGGWGIKEGLLTSEL